MKINNGINKSGILILVVIWIFVVTYAVRDTVNNYENREPYIYYLNSVYDRCTYYVYPNFRNEYRFIKYLFDFANVHPGTLIIVGKENDVFFEDGQAQLNSKDRKSPYFFFSRRDSCSLDYERINVNVDNKDIQFKIDLIRFKDGIEGKKLQTDFKKVNRNIVQSFFNYAKKDYETCKKTYNYIYELYNQSDVLILKQTYSDYGKYFTIEMY
jgi:hypothetical protein